MINIFWGCGKIGTRAIIFCKKAGQTIDYVCDQSFSAEVQDFKGIQTISVEGLNILSNESEICIFITVKKIDNVIDEIKKLGIKATIIPYNNFISWVRYNRSSFSNLFLLSNEKNNRDLVVFGLNNGLALGGVENWSVNEGKELVKAGLNVLLLLGNCNRGTKTDLLTIMLNNDEFENCVQLINYVACYRNVFFVENFPNGVSDYGFALKIILGESMQMIQVVHNDEEVYYKDYCSLNTYTDQCFVISSRIAQKLILHGYPKIKVKMLSWRISPDFYLPRKSIGKNQSLHIGYSGRVTVTQKRMDLLENVIKLVLNKAEDIIFEIAGTGDYFDQMQKNLAEYVSTGHVLLLGNIPHEDVPAFWHRQDIYISCSDHEGHSISQCEAIVSGAVPIATNVSGVSDDIEDGVTGYIVNCGDVNALAEKIIFLNDHRQLIMSMQKIGQSRAYNKYCISEHDDFVSFIKKGKIIDE